MGRKFIQEFKEFAIKGNAMDLAIGVVIGASFGKIVTSLVDDVIMPFVGLLVGGVDFSGLKFVLSRTAEGAAAATLNYGAFIQRVVDFTIVAFALFLVVKVMNALRRKEEADPAPKATPEDIILLREIRDSLRK